MASPDIRFAIEDAPSDADVEVLPNGLEAFNESRWPGHQPWRPLAVFAREGESIVAGLAGETYSGWLFIRYLWVSDALRGGGIGRELMAGAESRALERGCHSAWVDTSASRRRASTASLGMSRSANSTIRPDTRASSCRSGSRRGRRTKLRGPMISEA